MALMFHRRLAISVWAIAFFAVALAAPPPATLLLMPPTTLFVIALAGIAVLVGRRNLREDARRAELPYGGGRARPWSHGR